MKAEAIKFGTMVKIWCSWQSRYGVRCERYGMVEFTENGAGPWRCQEHTP
jgi:hypothetical protein